MTPNLTLIAYLAGYIARSLNVVTHIQNVLPASSPLLDSSYPPLSPETEEAMRSKAGELFDLAYAGRSPLISGITATEEKYKLWLQVITDSDFPYSDCKGASPMTSWQLNQLRKVADDINQQSEKYDADFRIFINPGPDFLSGIAADEKIKTAYVKSCGELDVLGSVFQEPGKNEFVKIVLLSNALSQAANHELSHAASLWEHPADLVDLFKKSIETQATRYALCDGYFGSSLMYDEICFGLHLGQGEYLDSFEALKFYGKLLFFPALGPTHHVNPYATGFGKLEWAILLSSLDPANLNQYKTEFVNEMLTKMKEYPALTGGPAEAITQILAMVVKEIPNKWISENKDFVHLALLGSQSGFLGNNLAKDLISNVINVREMSDFVKNILTPADAATFGLACQIITQHRNWDKNLMAAVATKLLIVAVKLVKKLSPRNAPVVEEEPPPSVEISKSASKQPVSRLIEKPIRFQPQLSTEKTLPYGKQKVIGEMLARLFPNKEPVFSFHTVTSYMEDKKIPKGELKRAMFMGKEPNTEAPAEAKKAFFVLYGNGPFKVLQVDLPPLSSGEAITLASGESYDLANLGSKDKVLEIKPRLPAPKQDVKTKKHDNKGTR